MEKREKCKQRCAAKTLVDVSSHCVWSAHHRTKVSMPAWPRYAARAARSESAANDCHRPRIPRVAADGLGHAAGPVDPRRRRDGSGRTGRLGHVTRARLTQIMNLLCLAPDIQEEILFLPATERGRDAITEKQLRPIAALADWRKQRQLWSRTLVDAERRKIDSSNRPGSVRAKSYNQAYCKRCRLESANGSKCHGG